MADPDVPIPVPHMSSEDFRRFGHQLIDWIADYHRTLADRPVLSTLKPGDVLSKLPAAAPDIGEPFDAILRDATDDCGPIMPGITHWQSPNFHGYFPANASFPAVLAELLSAGLGVQGMLWLTSPACTELETRMLDWLAAALGLPQSFVSTSPRGGGVIQGTASEATLVSLVAARSRALRTTAAAGQPRANHLTLYASTQAHSSIVKAAMIAGLARTPEDRTHLRLIQTDDDLAMNPDLLEAAIQNDRAQGFTPAWICATLGTTSSCAFDPLDPIGLIARRYNTWLHVDAAYAGSACICPEHRPMLRGVEHADSFCFNPHKWLLTNFDCNCLWTSDRDSLIGALSINPEYLRNAASQPAEPGKQPVIDYRDWQIPLGRRFRALKLWFVMRHYGIFGLRAHVREHLRIAAILESLVRADPRFEILAQRDPAVALICFRLRPRGGGSNPTTAEAETTALNRTLLERLNQSGRVFLTHTVLPLGGQNRYTLRMAIGAAQTQEHHVREAWALIARTADQLCSTT